MAFCLLIAKIYNVELRIINVIDLLNSFSVSIFIDFTRRELNIIINTKGDHRSKLQQLSQFKNIFRCHILAQTELRTEQYKTITYFTITAEIHLCSLGNFYCQYADRHMNL